MPKNKIRKFQENLTFPNLFQVEYHDLMAKGFNIKGKWHQAYFKNENPLILELGCGKGEYTVGLANKYPHHNYIGVDVKGARLWRGAMSSIEQKLTNAAFVRTQIETTDYYFEKDEVSEIWVTFPDPQPKPHKAHKRLISPKFLEIYKRFLTPYGIIHLKTDNLNLFEYCLEMIETEKHELILQTKDLYKSDAEEDVKIIQTYYEKRYLGEGKKINYLKFRLHE